MKKTQTKRRPPRDRKPVPTAEGATNQATTTEFEREGMGVAPKE
jgi:hypothetical protein